MMRRIGMVALLGGAVALALMGTERGAAAQVSVRAHLYWTWNDGAWRPHRYDWDRRADRFRLPGVGLWLSAGYMPPAGYCREWIPGVPPAYQPGPVPCDRLFLPYGYARSDVLIIGSPGYEGPVLGLRFTLGERERFDRDRAERERRAWAYRAHQRDRYGRSWSSVPFRSYERTGHGDHRYQRRDRYQPRDHYQRRDRRAHRDRQERPSRAHRRDGGRHGRG